MNVLKIAFAVLLVLAWFVAAMLVGMLLSPLDMRDVIALGLVLVMGATLERVFGLA